MHYSAVVSGETVDVTIRRTGDHIEATIDGRVYTLEAIAAQPGVYWLRWNNRSLEVSLIETESGYSITIGPHQIPVEILDPRKALRRAAHHGHDGAVEVRAPMPGKIVRVLAQEQADVEHDQGIVVMEAMKMQNEIKSPKKGRIRRLEVKEGDAVNSGGLIAVVE